MMASFDDWGASWSGTDLLVRQWDLATPDAEPAIVTIRGTDGDQPVYRLPPVKREAVYVGLSQTTDWGLELFGIPTVWKTTRGKDVKVCILDTGVDLNHPDLQGSILDAKDFTGSPAGPQDVNGHGCIDSEATLQTSSLGLSTIKEFFESRPESISEYSTQGEGVEYQTKRLVEKVLTYSLDPDTGGVVRNAIECVHRVKIDSPIVRVGLQGEISFALTPWHPLYVKAKDGSISRIRADHLKEGMSVCLPTAIPMPLSDSVVSVPVREGVECRGCQHRIYSQKRRQPGKRYACKRCGQASWETVSESEELTVDWAYLIGIVLTDGFYTLKSNRAEVSSVTTEILEKCEAICGRLNITSVIDWNTSRILMYSGRLVRMLAAVGIRQHEKSLTQGFPRYIAQSPTEVICAFLAGVIDGNGCISLTNTKNRVITFSKQFADDLCCLLNGLGLRASVRPQKPDRRERMVRGRLFKCNGHTGYHVVFRAVPAEIRQHLVHPKKKERSLIQPKPRAISKTVVSLSVEPYKGYFYDLTMVDQQRNNYLARGFFVSNTHCAGIVAAVDNALGVVGVAPESKLLCGKVLGDSGSGTGRQIAAGIHWAVDAGAHVISMSLGSASPDQAIYEALKFAISKGLYVVVAAGNEGPSLDTVGYPAQFPEMIAVGSIDRQKNISNFSSRGRQVDVVAPGDQVLSTYPIRNYAKLSGTSMATPFVSGTVALMLASGAQRPANQSELLKILTETAIDAGPGGFDPSYGYGLINPQGLVPKASMPEIYVRLEDLSPVGQTKLRQYMVDEQVRGTLTLADGRQAQIVFDLDKGPSFQLLSTVRTMNPFSI